MSSRRHLVVVQATSFCNIDCSYCYLADRHLNKRISETTLRNLFAKVARAPLEHSQIDFVWHFGEPLAAGIKFYERAFALCAAAFATSPKTSRHHFQTNAMLLSTKWVELIKRYRVGISVSIDGPAFLHNRYRTSRSGAGTHAATMSGIKLLKDNDIQFGALAVLTKDSLDFPDEIFEFLLENGIVDVGFNVEEVIGINTTSSVLQKSLIEKFGNFFVRIAELNFRECGAIKIRELSSVANSLVHPESDFENGAVTPLDVISIDHEGNIGTFSPELVGATSDRYVDFKFGNINDIELIDIRRNSKFVAVEADIVRGVEMCKAHCRYWSFCGGGVPAHKFFESGRFDVDETTSCRFSVKTIADALVSVLHDQI